MREKFKTVYRWIFRKKENSALALILCKLIFFTHSLMYQLKYIGIRRQSVRELNELKKRKSKNVFVFANGPSLGDLDFEKIKALVDSGDFDLITINSFASKAVEAYDLKPTMSVFIDPYHYPQSKDNSEMTEQAKADIEVVNKNEIIAFVPYKYYQNNLFEKPVPICGYRNLFGSNVSDITKPMGYMSVTAFFAMSAAIHLEYENIYICGYDNSYFKSFEVGEDNEKCFIDKHFYDKREAPRYVLPKDWYPHTSDLFFNTARHFKCLERIAQHGRNNVNILNIAKVTYTDAFDRCFALDVYKD